MIDTARLSLRKLSPADAPFIVQLLNDPAFVRFIGDRGVRSAGDAEQYILKGPVSSYEQFGFGLYLVELKEGRAPIGICGLLKRPYLDAVDLGFAFLPRFRARGYAFESASAVLAYARKVLGFDRVLAITTPDNDASIALLRRLGFRFERMCRASADEPELRLFATTVPESPVRSGT